MVLLTVATEDGSTFSVDVGLDMELENLMALLEADSSIPVDDQLVFHNGRQLTVLKDSLDSYGVKENDMLLLRQKSNDPSASQQAHVAGRNIAQDAETMRRQVLGNPQVMADLRRTNPELADAAQNDPARFRDLLGQLATMQESARLQREREMQLLEADPFDVEAQKKIEEAIRQERVLENMEQAMEDMPESFGQVHMLYINVEVNGVPVKAFVDSGAQRTIMSPSCAERCGIMRLIDTRFAGMAQGVGTGKILGRVHSAQLKMADLYLQCSFTILESKSVDLLFGLDMLKRHQCCIDLRQDALVIQDRKVPFLPEYEVPKGESQENGNPVPVETVDSSLSNAAAAAGPSAPSSSAAAAPGASAFPGSGRTLGQSPNASPKSKRVRSHSSSAASSPAAQPASSTGLPDGIAEEAVQSLVGLGATRAQAISLLEAAGGNAEVAASLLFSG
ncbi:DNA damage-inducible v-SNARE binding protein Ddi1 [Rhodotorula toruloides]|uniref:DNA damage-inducible protein 1 n=1 Tax=Rhodotorula toruloides TaxID=5286 RepID=A0A511KG56_RHOTO|nr:DNA damage-inducible v-SNARE binding protein Ddi1 [Rhodotorula toruloides]